MKRSFAFLALVATACITAPGRAQSGDVLSTLRDCMSVAGDAERLECYDRALGRSAGEPAPARAAAGATGVTTGAAASPPQAPPGPPTAAEFGLSEQARLERAGVQSQSSIESSVAAVGRSASDRQVVTLGNGQVWVQVEASTRVRLKSGDAVTIKRAAMGSYMLTKPGQGSMRVKRLE